MIRHLRSLGQYIILMGKTFSRPERFRMFLKKYVKEMASLGLEVSMHTPVYILPLVDSIAAATPPA